MKPRLIPSTDALRALILLPLLAMNVGGCSLNSSHNEVADWWYTETPEGESATSGNGTRETPYKGSSQTSTTNNNNNKR